LFFLRLSLLLPIYTSNFVLDELAEKLLHRIKLSGNEMEMIIHSLRRNCIIVVETPLNRAISRAAAGGVVDEGW
jgi:hypothetical protein